MPTIDLTGFEHTIVAHSIVLQEGLLKEGRSLGPDERRRSDPRPDPSAAAIEEATRADQQRLQGSWKLVSGALGGQPTDVVSSALLAFSDDKIVMEVGTRRVGTFTLDPARSPRRIDIVARSDDGTQEEKIRGVYEFRDDQLHLCLGPDDEPRPASVRSRPGTRQISLVMRREGPAQ